YLIKMAAAAGIQSTRAPFCTPPQTSSAHLTTRSRACNLAPKVVPFTSSSSCLPKGASLQSYSFFPSTLHLSKSIKREPVQFSRKTTVVHASASENGASSGLSIDLRGKRAFIAGIADDNGYGWAIAKSLAAAGAEILVGTWVPAMNIFETSWKRGKFDESRILPNGSLMEISKIYPMDAVYDTPEDVPEDVKSNKRYAGASNWTVQELAECVKQDFGSIDILVHSLANGPEVIKPLLETSRNGYLAAISASSYSFVSLLKYFIPIMNPGGSTISLTYIASERIIPGYGGGMSSAKSALESDTRVFQLFFASLDINIAGTK
ncbi:hypothetical protein KI387_014054, partial [Taxus chinensis]